MATGDFRVADAGAADTPRATLYHVDAGESAINAGEFVIEDSVQGYVKIAPDGMSTSDTVVGVAASDATHTASADGEVYVYDDPMYIFEGDATTPGNFAVGIRLTTVTLDVDGNGVQTIDEDDTTNGSLKLIDYDTDTGRAKVRVVASTHTTN